MCTRRTFVEQISGLTRRYGHRTERLHSTLAAVGLALAGQADARLAAVHALLKAGHSRRSVQQQLGMSWRTVKQFADVATPEELFTGQ
ncbi:hypothetical protein ACFU8W_35045 [Streptomyces sp. NPDC057565]|uniref:hypothetical protein n=1 Tax=Streptomyces sp. NPDC057565 TaxID=3346169 RepID=UPI003683967A